MQDTSTHKEINSMRKLKPVLGFTLVELMIVITIMMIAGLSLGWKMRHNARVAVVAASASQQKVIGEATKAYIANPNNEAIINAAPVSTITLAQLKAAASCGTTTPCLSASVNDKNPWGADHTITLRRNGVSKPFQYEFLVTTSGANAAYVSDGQVPLGEIGEAVAQVGQQVGFTTNLGVGGLRAVGSQGTWTATVANFPSIVAPGQIAYFYSSVGAPYDGIYLRVDGQNQATGNLNLGGNGLYNLKKGLNDPQIIAASSNPTNGVSNIYLDGNINLTSSTGDIKLDALQNGAMTNGGTGFATKSLLALAPHLVEVGSSLTQHGDTIPGITCQPGGTPAIYVIPSSEITPVYNGNTGYTFRATGSGPWNISIVGPDGFTPVAGSKIAIARTFCVF